MQQQGFGVEGGTGDDMMDSPQRNFGGGQLAAQFAAAADEDGMQQVPSLQNTGVSHTKASVKRASSGLNAVIGM